MGEISSRLPSDSLGTGSAPAWRRGIWTLLLVAAILRGLIIGLGGQYFWPDEGRYSVSQAAADLILQGHLREGLALPLRTGEHPGFKLAGIIPALVEAKVGSDNRIPALFFGLFSEVNLVLIWLCARRLGLGLAAQFWAVLLAACSVILFFQARHIQPYDLSLSLALTGLWVGMKPEGGGRRGVGVGLLAGAAFVTYMGYWLLAATSMGLFVLRGGWKLVSLARRFLWVSAGFLLLLGCCWLLDRWDGGVGTVNARGFSQMNYATGFGNPWWLPWEYLYHAEGLRLGLLLAGLAWALATVARAAEHRSGASPIFIGLAGFTVIYVGTGVVAELHLSLPTGRVIRVLVPFLALLGGLAADHFLAKFRAPRRAGVLLGLMLVGSAAGPFVTVLRQEFPRDFKVRGDRLLAARPPAPANSYYRFVNVENYIFRAETLATAPAETLAAAAHPYQFLPYLYEGFSVIERHERRGLDHRMRLVRMTLPAAARVTGDPEGMVTLRLKFRADQRGLSEPLLSLGPRAGGDLFFVNYDADGRQLRIGMERVGIGIITSEPISFVPEREYVVNLFSDLLLPAGGTDGAEAAAHRQNYAEVVSITWEGRQVVGERVKALPRGSAPITAGINAVGSGRAGTAFSGEILEVRRGGYPPLLRGRLAVAEYGALQEDVWLPLAAAGVPEPLVVAGTPGHATLGYVRVLPGGKAKLGVELWGVGAFESPELAVAGEVETEIIFHFPALYPPVGDARWGDVPRAIQEARRSRLTILVNDRVVLDQEVRDNGTPSSPMVFGQNPVGGSLVGGKFTGRMGRILRLPLGSER